MDITPKEKKEEKSDSIWNTVIYIVGQTIWCDSTNRRKYEQRH